MKSNIASCSAKAKQTLTDFLRDDEIVHVTSDHMVPGKRVLVLVDTTWDGGRIVLAPVSLIKVIFKM
jgi:hypothetical protein